MLTWIAENWDIIFGIFGAVVALGTTIVKLTPTQKDDNFWAKVVKVADWFSVVNTAENKAKIEAVVEKKKK